MAQIRKTRQQKIQLSQRRSEQIVAGDAGPVAEGPAVSINNSAIIAQEMAKPSLAIDNHVQATYSYAQQELRRIGWISLVCIGLLLVSALFISDMPLIAQARQWLGLPQLSPF